jgi:hypothetical protein
MSPEIEALFESAKKRIDAAIVLKWRGSRIATGKHVAKARRELAKRWGE